MKKWNEYEHLKNEFKPTWLRNKLARLAVARRKRDEWKNSKRVNRRLTR